MLATLMAEVMDARQRFIAALEESESTRNDTVDCAAVAIEAYGSALQRLHAFILAELPPDHLRKCDY